MKKKKFIVFIFFSLIIVIIGLSAITNNKVSNIVDYSNVSYLKVYVYNNDKMSEKRLPNDNINKLEDMLNNLETKKLSTIKANEQKKIKGYQVNMANIYYIRQKEPKGLGHAVLCAKSFIGDEPFAVLLGDDIVVNDGGEPALKQLIDAYMSKEASVVGVQTVPHQDVCKYGIVSPSKTHSIECNGRLVKLSDMVEKPEVDKAPSDMAVLGRYVLTPKVFELLETQGKGAGGEIQLTDAIKRLMDIQAVYAYDFEGIRYDVGDKFGFIKATIDFSLNRDDLKEKVREYIESIVKEDK